MDPRTTLAAAVVTAAALVAPAHAYAASSKGCENGGFALTLGDGGVVSGDQKNVSIPASRLGPTLQVRGRYVGFDVDTSTFAVLNYAFTGAPTRST